MASLISAAGTNNSFLQTVVRADAAFCAVCGVSLLAGAGPIAAFLGWNNSLGVMALGGGLLVYAAELLWMTRKQPAGRGLVRMVMLLNWVWVLASVVILATGVPAVTPGGWWAIAGQADLVALLALAQGYALRKMRA